MTAVDYPGARTPRIAAVGLASWDRLLVVDRHPEPGGYAVVQREASLPGGTTTNTAAALARLGAAVNLVAMVGDDDAGRALRDAMIGEGVDCRWLGCRPGEPTDAATVVVASDPPERTIYWHQGAQLVRGDRLDLAAVFGHDLVLLDVADAPLRRFLVDLPAHTAPATRLLGTLTYLADADIPDALDLALRHDVMVGNEREWRHLTGTADLDAATQAIRTRMPGSTLRAAVATRGAAGCRVWTRGETWDLPAFPVAAVDTTGAGDAFTAGIAYGVALRWPWPAAARFANAVGALSTRALGGQAALPSPREMIHLMAEHATEWDE